MSAEVAVIESDVSALEGLDPASREIAITQLLGQAKQFMEVAMKQPDAPRVMADFKAQIITIAEYAKQKRMSEDLQIDATVMVRRSERGLGLAVRQGQEAGVIAKRGDGSQQDYMRGGKLVRGAKAPAANISSPTEYMGRNGSTTVETYAMADGVTDSQFEEALDTARAERNVSRANIVRKLKHEVAPSREPSSPHKTAQMMERVTTALWGLRHSLQEITAVDRDLDQAQASAWIKEFTSTSQELNRIKNLLKETQK